MNFNAMIGYEGRFPLQYMVTVRSLLEKSSDAFDVSPIILPDLMAKGLYFRPTSRKDNRLFDEVSGAPMSTEFAISRFFIPLLNRWRGWTLFCDSDFLFRADIDEVLAMADAKYAVMCVKHEYNPPEGTKMDGQAQLRYNRKNWSSLMLFNNEHPSNRALTIHKLNNTPGRDLHAFDWLTDEEIGSIPPAWNWLQGHSTIEQHGEPKAVHYTLGTPNLDGYEDSPYADEWKNLAAEMSIYANGQT